MRKFRSEQEWVELIAKFDPSVQTAKAFCQQHQIGLTRFYEKRKSLIASEQTQSGNSGFIKAEIAKNNSKASVSSFESMISPTATAQVNLILSVKHGSLLLPISTPANYLATLLKALS